MRLKEKLGLIGCGNMGSAVLRGVLAKKIISPNHVRIYDVVNLKAKALVQETKVQICGSEEEAVGDSDIILLAVKPQDFRLLAAKIKSGLRSEKILISILAGVSLAELKKCASSASIVRAMPNLAATVGEAMTAITGTRKRALQIAEQVFSACGRVVRLPEKFFDLVTAVSGSGPAYFFFIMELLQEAGQSEGLNEGIARELAVQTAVGTARLARLSECSPAELRQKVTSKKGTTEAALQYLKEKNFSAIFKAAVLKAMKRSRELSRGK